MGQSTLPVATATRVAKMATMARDGLIDQCPSNEEWSVLWLGMGPIAAQRLA
jgi:hypothetical protein